MRKLIVFLFSITLLGLIMCLVYLGAAIYDTSEKLTIEPYVFQPGNLSRDRIGRPQPFDKLSDSFIQARLIRKFMHEYFYVIPDMNDLDRRAAPGSVLAAMSSPQVFEEWKKVILPELRKYAESRQLQHVHIERPTERSGDYWQVDYEIVYNDRPNDMSALPKSESNTIYIMYDYENGIRETMGGSRFNIGKYLEQGGDPATLFKFKVTKVAI